MQSGSSSTTPRAAFGSGTQLRILTGQRLLVAAVELLHFSCCWFMGFPFRDYTHCQMSVSA